MPVDVKKHKNGVTQVTISDEMTIYNALEQKQQIWPLCRSGNSVQINLRQVSDIDSAGAQLLMFLKREAQAVGIELSLVEHSPAVIDVLETLNLSKLFGDPIVIAADRSKP